MIIYFEPRRRARALSDHVASDDGPTRFECSITEIQRIAAEYTADELRAKLFRTASRSE